MSSKFRWNKNIMSDIKKQVGKNLPNDISKNPQKYLNDFKKQNPELSCLYDGGDFIVQGNKIVCKNCKAPLNIKIEWE